MANLGEMFNPLKQYASKIADVFSKASYTGAEMYGSASHPAPPEAIKGILGFTPGVGDAISAYDAYESAKHGNWADAVLNGVGVLPFVPGLGGVIKHIPTPDWNKVRKQSTFPLGDWFEEGRMIRPEVEQLAFDAQSLSPIDRMATLRAMKEKSSGKIRYAWPSGAALHSDVGRQLNLNPDDWTHVEFYP